jgi:pSer/pThr/pTyr-binding forkhead associated (FHA) protein
MDTSYGKLILQNLDGPEQEYELAKGSISLGRALTNDIVFSDVRVSRSHALVENSPQGVTIKDLGSSNGTHVNGVKIEQEILKHGDTIGLGDQQMRFFLEDPREEIGLTQIDTQLQLDQTLNQEFLPVAINETTSPSLVIFTKDQTWNIDLINLDQVTIGRDENCTISIDSSNISRHHARVDRIGETYVLKDLGSTNGTWLDRKCIDEHILQDGDVFRIGRAQIIFKQGFQEHALTIADEMLEIPHGRRTVIFIPGMMGSQLWVGNDRIWPDMKTIFTNPEIYTYPSDIPIEPRGIVDQVVIIPNLIKQDQYNRISQYLVEELHYRLGEDYFEFAYDWRQDVRKTARQLGSMIESLPSSQPIIIVAHSLGTMVTRYYIEKLGGKDRVERAILMGGPHQGAVKGLTSMLIAPEVLPFGLLGERLRKILLTFPTSFQILPIYSVGVDQEGNKINFLKDESWVDPNYAPLLRTGRDFRRELGMTTSIPYVSIFGYGINTISKVSVIRDTARKLLKVDYLRENKGDGSVLEQSAYLKGSEIHPVHQHHGALFVDNDVKMRLKLELTQSL